MTQLVQMIGAVARGVARSHVLRVATVTALVALAMIIAA